MEGVVGGGEPVEEGLRWVGVPIAVDELVVMEFAFFLWAIVLGAEVLGEIGAGIVGEGMEVG